jgi:hypothetical protein
MNLFQVILLIFGLFLMLFSGSISQFIDFTKIFNLFSKLRGENHYLRDDTESERNKLLGTAASVEKPILKGNRPGFFLRFNISGKDILYGACMLCGVLAKEFWDFINESGYIGIKPPRLIAALIVSPIIYASIYSQFVKGKITLLGAAIAFQNGFFWQAIFSTSQGGK